MQRKPSSHVLSAKGANWCFATNGFCIVWNNGIWTAAAVQTGSNILWWLVADHCKYEYYHARSLFFSIMRRVEAIIVVLGPSLYYTFWTCFFHRDFDVLFLPLRERLSVAKVRDVRGARRGDVSAKWPSRDCSLKIQSCHDETRTVYAPRSGNE